MSMADRSVLNLTRLGWGLAVPAAFLLALGLSTIHAADTGTTETGLIADSAAVGGGLDDHGAVGLHGVLDAIGQAGTDLAMADLADEAERWLGIPVIAINVATYWSALRANGIGDRVEGFGSLLAEH